MFETNLPIATLVERLREDAGSGTNRQDPLVEAIRHSFRSRVARQSFVKLGDGKVVSVSRQKMDNGNVVVVFEDVTEETKAHERIRQLAWADDLTGLMNRASFKEVFKKTLDLMDDDATVALHLIDLDHFKSVNDTLGHPTGDLLLVEVAKRITAACGEDGVVARLGGDEFVIIQRLMVDGDSPAALAQRIMSRRLPDLRDPQPPHQHRRELRRRPGPAARQDGGRAAEARRHGALQGQGARPQLHRVLRGEPRRHGAAAPRARARYPHRGREGRVHRSPSSPSSPCRSARSPRSRR